jgi:N12 class adenine-specific DNA methylase
MKGWFKEQREQRGRQVAFMHLDGLVDWIVEHRLVNELRAALHEQGIDSEDSHHAGSMIAGARQ